MLPAKVPAAALSLLLAAQGVCLTLLLVPAAAAAAAANDDDDDVRIEGTADSSSMVAWLLLVGSPVEAMKDGYVTRSSSMNVAPSELVGQTTEISPAPAKVAVAGTSWLQLALLLLRAVVKVPVELSRTGGQHTCSCCWCLRCWWCCCGTGGAKCCCSLGGRQF
jgi:hypothetical protein